METRIEIEKAENGYSLRVWKEEDKEESEDDYGYHEPKIMVATELEEVNKIVTKTFEGK